MDAKITTIPRNKWLNSILAGGLFLIASLVQAGPLNEGFEATYSLSKNGLTVASVERRLLVKNNFLHFSSHAEVSGIASLLSDETIHEDSVLEFNNGTLLSHLYSHEQKSHDKIIHVIFNYSNNTIINTGNNKTWPLAANAFDILGFQIGLAQALKQGHEELRFTIVEQKRIGNHQLQQIGSETLQLAGHSLATTKLRYLDKKKNRQFTFWCANRLDFLPVRVERKDADGDISLLELDRWHSNPSLVTD
ncbi:MAG: DUF3108 domain-containing protein [Thioalkalispiraceae bacterium]|jgi:hypothetical protein